MAPVLATLSIILTCVTPFGAFAEGNSGTGGTDGSKVDPALVRYYLEGDVLKSAILNYLHSIDLSKVKDKSIRSVLSRAMQNQELQKDINTSGNYLLRDECPSDNAEKPLASTDFGAIGGPICFAIPRIVAEYKNLSTEDFVIRLASVAIHEHIHHFQVNSPVDNNEANEVEARKIMSHVRDTAKTAQVTTLVWAEELQDKNTYKNWWLIDFNPGTRFTLKKDIIFVSNQNTVTFTFAKDYKAPNYPATTTTTSRYTCNLIAANTSDKWRKLKTGTILTVKSVTNVGPKPQYAYQDGGRPVLFTVDHPQIQGLECSAFSVRKIDLLTPGARQAKPMDYLELQEVLKEVMDITVVEPELM